MHNEMVTCIEACTRCQAVCLHTFEHCVNKGGRHANPAHMRHLVDCSDICTVAANFMNRGSHLHTEVCTACAAVCEHCAQSCQRINDDEHMQRCIDACRHCAAMCNEMASLHAA